MLDMPQFKHNKASTAPPKREDTCSEASLSSLYSEDNTCSGYLSPQQPKGDGYPPFYHAQSSPQQPSQGDITPNFFRRRMRGSPGRTTYLDPTLTKINYYMAHGTVEKALAPYKYWTDYYQYLRKKGYSISNVAALDKFCETDWSDAWVTNADTKLRLCRYFYDSKLKKFVRSKKSK